MSQKDIKTKKSCSIHTNTDHSRWCIFLCDHIQEDITMENSTTKDPPKQSPQARIGVDGRGKEGDVKYWWKKKSDRARHLPPLVHFNPATDLRGGVGGTTTHRNRRTPMSSSSPTASSKSVPSNPQRPRVRVSLYRRRPTLTQDITLI